MTDLRKAAEMALYALLDARQVMDITYKDKHAYADEIEALRQALAQPELTATSIHYPDCWDTDCYPTLQDAIKEIGSFKCTNDDCAQTKLEPVTCVCKEPTALGVVYRQNAPCFYYTAPPKQWVGLTDEEIDSIFVDYGWCISTLYLRVVRSIEAKLKEKNT